MLKLAHKKMDVWKKSMLLVKQVYLFTDKLPSDEKFNLTSQMRRASISIASNIAEDFARLSSLEKKRFIEISRSSLVELDTQFEACLQIGYLVKSDLDEVDDLLNHIFAMLTSLINKIK